MRGVNFSSDLLVGPTSRLSLNEAKAQIRNRFELSRLSIHLKQIEKERSISACYYTRQLNTLQQEVHDVRCSTGIAVKSAPAIMNFKRFKKKTKRNDSPANTIDFTDEFINIQNESTYEMLYNVVNAKEPIYKYNPFLHTKKLDHDSDTDTSTLTESLNESFLSGNSDVDKQDIPIMVNNKVDNENDDELQPPKIYSYHERKLSLGDDKLRNAYNKICDARDKIPPRNLERIEKLKAIDPVFAKRYKKYKTSTNAGKAPYFEPHDTKIRIILSKAKLEQQKIDMHENFKVNNVIRSNPYLKIQKKLNHRVAQFVKKLPIN